MTKKGRKLPLVKTTIEGDEGRIIDALKLAFVADPATRWTWPDPQRYLLHFSSSSNQKNIPFYERHGFELLGTIKVNTSPIIYPMLRKPHML